MIGVIIVWIFIIFGVLSVFFAGLKKILEIVSLIVKFFAGVLVSMLVIELLQLEFKTGWGEFAFVVVGAIIVTSVVVILSGVFRLVGYSIHYFTWSFTLLLLFDILRDKVEINFMTYAIVLFVFPRIIWISDRRATVSEYSHSKYSILDDMTTMFYDVKGVDYFEDSGMSWEFMPMQIIIAALFYIMGNALIQNTCPIESSWLSVFYTILLTVINIVFDMFVFRKIDESFN